MCSVTSLEGRFRGPVIGKSHPGRARARYLGSYWLTRSYTFPSPVNSERAIFALRVGFSAAAAAIVLVGASLNVTGHAGADAFFAVVAGLLAPWSGVLHLIRQGSGPLVPAPGMCTPLSHPFLP